jgi:hypothetical protein
VVKVKTGCQLTCPECGSVSMETMPIDACIYFFECLHCHAVLLPKKGTLLRVLFDDFNTATMSGSYHVA